MEGGAVRSSSPHSSLSPLLFSFAPPTPHDTMLSLSTRPAAASRPGAATPAAKAARPAAARPAALVPARPSVRAAAATGEGERGHEESVACRVSCDGSE